MESPMISMLILNPVFTFANADLIKTKHKNNFSNILLRFYKYDSVVLVKGFYP